MKTALGLILCATSAQAFAPSTSGVRSFTSLQSHFSTVQTQLKDKDLLEKSLVKLGLPVTLPTTEETVTVQGYKGETMEAQFAIPQENGKDIGFRWNGESYELVADLQFWQQSVPMDAFLDKVHQRYSVETILDTAAEDGFNMEELVENNVDGTVTIELSRYNTMTA